MKAKEFYEVRQENKTIGGATDNSEYFFIKADNKLVKILASAGIQSAAIHGNKSQQARQTALLQFKSGTLRVLVATDIAARGIDIDSLTHVLNYELPNVPETYVHRIGRTARAGAAGVAISLCSTEELKYLKDIEKLIGKKLTPRA